MEANTQPQLSAWQVWNNEVLRRLQDVECHCSDLDHVSVVVAQWYPADDHVDGADRLDLVHVIILEFTVEEVVEVV